MGHPFSEVCKTVEAITYRLPTEIARWDAPPEFDSRQQSSSSDNHETFDGRCDNVMANLIADAHARTGWWRWSSLLAAPTRPLTIPRWKASELTVPTTRLASEPSALMRAAASSNATSPHGQQ